MEVKFKFKCGQRVEDSLTGFNGIIDGAAIWINGCVRYSVIPKIKKGENTRPEGWWIDEAQLNLLDDGITKEAEKRQKRTGGPSMKSTGSRF